MLPKSVLIGLESSRNPLSKRYTHYLESLPIHHTALKLLQQGSSIHQPVN
jgi:hypothetical protein